MHAQQIGTTGKVIDPRGVTAAAHYNQHPSGVEIKDLNGGLSAHMAAALKYVARHALKGDARKDLDKSLTYIGYEKERLTRLIAEAGPIGFLANPDFGTYETALSRRFCEAEQNRAVRRFALLVCCRVPAPQYLSYLDAAITHVEALIAELAR